MKPHKYKEKILADFGGKNKNDLNLKLDKLVEMSGGKVDDVEKSDELKKNKTQQEIFDDCISKLNDYLDDDKKLTIENILNGFKTDHEKFELIIEAYKLFKGPHEITEIPWQITTMFMDSVQNNKYGIHMFEPKKGVVMFEILHE